MRVLYACLDPGVPVGGTKGASTHLAEMVRALREDGHHVDVVAREVEAGAAASPLRPPGRQLRAALLRGPLHRARAATESRWTARRLAEHVARTAPDLVYERYALGRPEMAAVARAAGVPRVLEVNAPLADEAARFRSQTASPRSRAAEAAAWAAADLVVVPSHPLAARVRDAGQPRVLVVPNAVDPSRFTVRGDSRERRAALGLEDRFVVGFVGSLKPWHDLDVLVDAVSLLPAEVRATLLVVGDGPLREHLAERSAASGVDLRCVGAVPHAQVVDHLAATDACVASLLPDPALDYFSPLKALEYLAAGRPTVVADVGDLRLLAAEGVALAYRAGSAPDLAAVLARLARDSDLRAALSARGREHAGSHTWQASARRVLAEVARPVVSS